MTRPLAGITVVDLPHVLAGGSVAHRDALLARADAPAGPFLDPAPAFGRDTTEILTPEARHEPT